jgi:hypothetical protein
MAAQIPAALSERLFSAYVGVDQYLPFGHIRDRTTDPPRSGARGARVDPN